MIKCPVCGKHIKESYKFCSNCGTPLNSNSQPFVEPVSLKEGGYSRWTIVMIGIGLCFILATIILLAFSKYDIDEDWRYWPIILSTVGLMCPLGILKKQEITDQEWTLMFNSAAVGFVIAFVFGLIIKGDHRGFWTEIFYALTTETMYYVYLVLLVLSSFITIWNRKCGIILTGALGGILIPLAFFSILALLISTIIVIGVIIYLFNKVWFSGDSGGSSSSGDFGSEPSFGDGDMN